MPDITIEMHDLETSKEKKRLYDIEYRTRNKDKRSFQNREWYGKTRKERFKSNPQCYLWSVARARARMYNTEFSIDPIDIIVPKVCPILGVELVKGDGYLPNAMSLDRVDNSLGYIKGNVRVISRKANLMKSSLNIEILERILKYIKGEV